MEIEFKVWDTVHKSMHRVNSIEFIDRIEGRTGYSVFVDSDVQCRWVDADKGILLPYIGVKDCEGNKIFLGDVIEVDNSYKEDKCKIICTVVNESGYIFELAHESGGKWTRRFEYPETLKVIGSIYKK